MVRKISSDLDFLLIDTGAGISDNVVELLLMAERVVVVTSFDPAAIVDAYAVIKILTHERAGERNRRRRQRDAQTPRRRSPCSASSMSPPEFLNRTLRFFGYIVSTIPAVREAVLGQRPVVEHQPQAPASRCFRILASRLAGFIAAWRQPSSGSPAARRWRDPMRLSPECGAAVGPEGRFGRLQPRCGAEAVDEARRTRPRGVQSARARRTSSS